MKRTFLIIITFGIYLLVEENKKTWQIIEEFDKLIASNDEFLKGKS